MEKGYKNAAFFFLLLLPLVAAGFLKTYFIYVPGFDFPANISRYSHLHFFIAAAWLILMLVQPLLIRAGNHRWHRRLGRLSFFVFPLFLLSFLPLVWKVAQSPEPVNLFFPLADAVLLVLFYSLGIYYRKNTAIHMRYMIALALVFLGPTLGRIGPIFFGLSGMLTQTLLYALVVILLFSLVIRDRIHHRPYYPYLVALAGFGIHMSTFYILFH